MPEVLNRASILGYSGFPPSRLCHNCHPELVSGSHVFITTRNYEILNQVQNDNSPNVMIVTQSVRGNDSKNVQTIFELWDDLIELIFDDPRCSGLFEFRDNVPYDPFIDHYFKGVPLLVR